MNGVLALAIRAALAAAAPAPAEAEAAPGPDPSGLREKPPHVLVAEGNQMYAGGDYDGAISRYGAAQAARPNSPEVDVDLGLAHMRKGEHDRAAEYFIAAAAKGGGRLASKAHYYLGNGRARQGRFEDAIDAYKAALEADPANADASHNLELVRQHLKTLKEDEAKRKAAEEEFRRRLEALRKELAALVEAQAAALARTWSTDHESAGPFAVKEHFEELQALAKEAKPVPDELGARVARALVIGRKLEERPSTPKELARTERSLASRAHEAASTAAVLAADLREAAGPAPKPQGAPPGQEPGKPPEHPMIGALERAGGAAEEGARRLEEAADILATAPEHPARPAEPEEATALWKLVRALSELTPPPQQGQGGMPKELEEALRKMAKLRERQGALVRDLWATLPASRGKLPAADEQKAFWESVRAGEAPTEDARVPMARLEIMGSGRPGSKTDPAQLAEGEKALAHETRALAAEVEALAVKAEGGGGAREALGAVVGMLRDAADSMEAGASGLEAAPPDGPVAEDAAVRAFVRLSQAPDAMTELMARLGGMLAEQMMLVLDTWKTDTSSRGPVATEDEMKAAAEALAKATQGAGPVELEPELEAKLGRAAPAAVAARLGDAAGRKRDGGEFAKLEADLAKRAREAAEDLRKLASSGRPGEANPAAAMFEGAAADVDAAAARMDEAALALPTSLGEAEPPEARAVAALMRAMARFSSGAAGQSGRQGEEGNESRREDSERREGEKGEEAEKKEGEKQEGEEKEPREEQSELARPGEEEKPSEDEKKKARKTERMSAERALEEAAQEERELRRDINKRRGTKGVEVRRDW